MPKNFTIDEIVEIWKTDKIVCIVTSLNSHSDSEGVEYKNAKQLYFYEMQNTQNNETTFRKALLEATQPLFLSKLTWKEFKAKYGDKVKLETLNLSEFCY